LSVAAFGKSATARLVGETFARLGDALLGGGQRDADVLLPGGAVETARTDENAQVGEFGDHLPAVLASIGAAGPQVQAGLGMVDGVARPGQGAQQPLPAVVVD